MHLPGETKVFINDSLYLYDKDKSKCKSLRDAGHIHALGQKWIAENHDHDHKQLWFTVSGNLLIEEN